ncbi:MAG: VCBS repeat-containing protein [Acidobacteria bacterium]|nr:VCBS repeat-containing protein [Acidobacteriota bacterium]
MNRDGKPDLIGNSAQPGGSFPNSIAWFEAPRFERHILADKDAPGLSHYLGFGDVNGDGRPDVASGAKTPPEGNWFAWWEAPQDPRAVWKKHLIAANQEGASNIFVVDVNGDGKADLLSSRGHGKGVLWFEGPGWKPREIDGAHQYPHSLAPGDLDGDGDVDAVACSAVYAGEPKAPRLAWYENTGHGRFRTHEISATQASYDVKLADMDRDGDLDILVAGQESRNVVWYENRLKAGRVR